MDQTTKLKIEFFELVRLLNQSNQKINQKTEISFFIESTKDKSVLCATTNNVYKIQLILKQGRYQWRPCGLSGLDLTEKELSKLFKYQDLSVLPADVITKTIKSFIFQELNEQ